MVKSKLSPHHVLIAVWNAAFINRYNIQNFARIYLLGFFSTVIFEEKNTAHFCHWYLEFFICSSPLACRITKNFFCSFNLIRRRAQSFSSHMVGSRPKKKKKKIILFFVHSHELRNQGAKNEKMAKTIKNKTILKL